MLPLDIATSSYRDLQSLVKAVLPDLIRVNGIQSKQNSQFQTGERYTAQILTKTGSTRFQVQVGESVLDLTLPVDKSVGQSLDLTVVTDQPQLRFALTRDLVKVVRQQKSPGEPGDAERPPEFTQTQISNSAKVLSRLINQLEQPQLQTTALVKNAKDALTSEMISTTQPLVMQVPPKAEELAAKLSKAFSQSGLFYESHQVQWLSGERSLKELLAEPQGQLSVRNKFIKQSAEGNDSPISKSPNDIPKTKEEADIQALTTFLTKEKTVSSEVIHPQIRPVVESQLSGLNTNELVWRGEVWPGQLMQWQIHDDPKHRSPTSADASEIAEWSTSLKLELPHLGNVEFTIRLQDDKLYLHAQSVSIKTDTQLVQALPQLTDSLKQMNLELADFQHEIKASDEHAE